MGIPFFSNIAGTVRKAFRLGGDGPTLRQGTADPNSTQVAGSDGDIYIQFDTQQQFYQRRLGIWVPIGGEAFTRTAVTDATYYVQATDYYLGVSYAGAVDIHLPAGIENKTIIVKDESGQASSNQPINIIADGSELIDGDPEAIIVSGYTSVTLVFGGGNWHLV